MNRKGITFKVFFITSILLVVSALIIYLTFYFLLPNFYYNYKKDNLNSGVSELIHSLETDDWEEIEHSVNQFVQEYNVRLIIQNELGYVIYFPMDHYFTEELNRNSFPHMRQNFNRRLLEENWNASDVITITEPFQFQEDPHQYVLTVSAPLQPIDEASKVIIMFLPYMLIVIGLISIVGALFYSNIIAKPLIKLNQTAKKMAELDFSTSSKINTGDELGELSKSLNKLSTNLQRNMNDLNKANLQLKDDIQKEREQEAKRREFVATISHELKTPITSVSGQLEGMIYEIGPFKDRDKYLRQSYNIMKEMEQLVHEILDISQLESFDLKPHMNKINLTDLIEKTVADFQYFCEEKNLTLKKSIHTDVYVSGDGKLLAKAIANILSNAVKYSSEGEMVRVDLIDMSDLIHFQVLNTGVSIEEGEIKNIFAPFYRVEKSRNRKTGGSGLGLYIVKKILEMHNLRFSINNAADGVLFTIIFPKP